MPAKDDVDKVAEARTQQPSASAIVPNAADRAVDAARREDKEEKRQRMIKVNKNKTKMVTMRAKKRLLLPKEFAKGKQIDRQIKAGQTAQVPMHIAEMFCAPMLGFYADEGGEHSGVNRPRHKIIRAVIVSES